MAQAQQSSHNAVSLTPVHVDINYTDEIKSLLQSYEQQRNPSFKAFKEIWKTLNFSAAHQAAKGDKVDYLHSLYYTFIALWQAILSVDRAAKELRNADCYHVLKKMVTEGSLLFSAALHPASLRTYIPAYGNDNSRIQPPPPPPQSDANMADGDGEEENELIRIDPQSQPPNKPLTNDSMQDLVVGVIDVDKIDKMAKSYYVAKVQPLSVSAALEIDLSQLPLPPPSLNFVHANLGDDLRTIISDYGQKRMENLFTPTPLNTASTENTNSSSTSTLSSPILVPQISATPTVARRGGRRSAVALVSATTTTPTNKNADTITPTTSQNEAGPSTRRRRRRLIQDDEGDGEEGGDGDSSSERPARRRGRAKQ